MCDKHILGALIHMDLSMKMKWDSIIAYTWDVMWSQ